MKRFFIKAKPIRLGRWNKDNWKIKVDNANMDYCYRPKNRSQPTFTKSKPIKIP